MNKYPTSDGHKFTRIKDAREWQAALDYNKILKPIEEHYGIGQIKLNLKHFTEIITLRKYLAYYLDFDIEEVEKIPIDIDGGISVLIDRSAREVEVL